MQFRSVGIAVAGLVCFFAAGTPLAAEPTGAQPLGNPGEWVTTPDYPQEALRDDLQGVVAFVLTIDTLGRVERCTVTQSSGADILDNAACNLITLRARFAPARDRRGRPMVGSYSSRVRWILPQNYPQPVPAELEHVFIVEVDGSLSGCEMIRSNGVPPEKLAAAKTPCEQHITTTPFLNEAGVPVRRRVRVYARTRIEPLP